MKPLEEETVEVRRVAGQLSELQSAAAVFADTTAIVMLYGRRPQLARVENGTIVGPNGPVDLASVYRADLFDDHRHLRWYRRQGSATARAVLITEGPFSATGFDEEQVLRCLPLQQRYLLWPHFDEANSLGALEPGWHWAGSTRTAGFEVPVAAQVDKRMALITREYVVVDTSVTDRLDGNAFVLDERYVGIQPVELTDQEASSD